MFVDTTPPLVLAILSIVLIYAKEITIFNYLNKLKFWRVFILWSLARRFSVILPSFMALPSSATNGGGKVLLNTLRGDIVINLHSSLAPQHCSLFLDWVANVLYLVDVPCSQRCAMSLLLQ